VKSGGGPQEDRANAIAVAATGNFVVTGIFTGVVDVGARTLFGLGRPDAFIAGYDASGNNLWANTTEASMFAIGSDVALDPEGNAVMTGYFVWSAVFDPDTLFSASRDSADVFVAKYDSSGYPMWAKRGGGLGHDQADAVVVDDSGRVTIAGTLQGAATFDSVTVDSKGVLDLFVVQYDNDGNLLWLKQDGGSSYQGISGMSRDNLGNYYVAGYFGGTTKLDTFHLTSVGSQDMFVAKLGESRLPADKIILDVPQTTAFRGDTIVVGLYVYLTADSSFNSLEINLRGFQGRLDFLEVVTDPTLTGNAEWSFEVNDTDTLLAIAAAGANAIRGEGTLLGLRFFVPDTVLGFIPVEVHSAVFDTGVIPVQSSAGGVEVRLRPHYGDVDENGKVQAFDASLILKQLVGYVSLDTQQTLNADVTLDGTLILQFVVGLIDSLPYVPQEGGLVASAQVDMEGASLGEGRIVSIPIRFTEGRNLLGFDGKLAYAPQYLRLIQVVWPKELSDSAIKTDHDGGRIEMAGIGKFGEEGILATLQFEMIGEPLGPNTVVVQELRFNEGPVQKNVTKVSLEDLTVGVSENVEKVPTRFALFQNYPNPFNPETQIRYQVPEKAHVRLRILNLLGEEVAALVDEEKIPGYYSVTWGGTDRTGRRVASGVYLYRLEAGTFVDVKKMVVIK
jgi:hypothetical protein